MGSYYNLKFVLLHCFEYSCVVYFFGFSYAFRNNYCIKWVNLKEYLPMPIRLRGEGRNNFKHEIEIMNINKCVLFLKVVMYLMGCKVCSSIQYNHKKKNKKFISYLQKNVTTIDSDQSNFGRSLKKDLMACFFFLETILLHLTFLKLLKEFSLWHFS